MSVLDCQQCVTANAANGIGSGLPSSFSLNDLMSHAASPLLRHNITAATQQATGEFSALTGEFRSVRQSNASVFVESQRSFQSTGSSCVGNYPPTINFGMDSRALVEHQPNVGYGVYMASPQQVDSVQVAVPMRHTVHDVLAPVCHTCPSLDLNHEVFSDSASPMFGTDQPPPLPPKTSVVSMCVCVCLNITS